MTLILAIDPGPSTSAWAFLQDDHGPHPFAEYPNDELLECLRKPAIEFGAFLQGVDAFVIENIEPRYGLQMGWETLDTARWIGRFEEAAHPVPVTLLRRSEVLRHLGVVTSPKKGEKRVSADAGVRQALVDRYGGSKAEAIGTKARPGPLYGIAGDVWAALAVGVTWIDTRGGRPPGFQAGDHR